MVDRKRKSYDEIIESHPELKGVIQEKSWDFIGVSDKNTLEYLSKTWFENLETNINSKRFRRHGSLSKDCMYFGKNKAVIAIGAGQSLNKNKNVLKAINDIDGLKDLANRDFIIVASNHMFKQLLKENIIPDFVLLVDASDVVMDQLTKDIPESGRNCILIAGLHCSPRVLKRWEKQGRDIRFYLTGSPGMAEKFKEVTNRDSGDIIVQQGGNVLNTCWSIALKYFGSSVFMAVGNDLSYPLVDDVSRRRELYYADGDYSTNDKTTGTGRDEAGRKDGWMGFTLSKSNIISIDATEKYNIELSPVGTTGTLWVYKTWIEANVAANTGNPNIKYYYYNCTEGGISGVMCRDDTEIGRADINNWFMMDSVCKRWRTRTLEDAVGEFLKAKEALYGGKFYAVS